MKYIYITFTLLATCLMTSIEANVLDRQKLQQVYVLVKHCNLRGHPLEVFKNPDVDENLLEETKCSVGCVMRKLDMITEYYTLNMDGVNKMKLFFKDNLSINHAGLRCTKKEIHRTCAKVRGKNDCDFAGKFFTCMVEHCYVGRIHSSY